MPSGKEILEKSESLEDETKETIEERVVGLTEMIPDAVGKLGQLLWKSFLITCDASWIFFTTIALVLGPVIYEREWQRVNQPGNEGNNKNKKEQQILKIISQTFEVKSNH